MTQAKQTGRPPESSQLLPWYRYPWPWVAIGIPAVAVIGGLLTLYLAVTHPDPLVVDSGKYQEISSGLQAQEPADSASPAAQPEREDRDGER
jgi:hypothetical protein